MLIIAVTFVLAATLVTVSLVMTSKILTEEAASHMNLFCEERGDDLNTELLRIEDAVTSLSRWAKSKIPDVETISDDSELRDKIVDDAVDLICFMTEDNKFIQGAYIHYSLDITGVTGREEGVYFTRDDREISLIYHLPRKRSRRILLLITGITDRSETRRHFGQNPISITALTITSSLMSSLSILMMFR